MKLSPRQVEALKAVEKGLFFPDLVREDDGWHARWRGTAGDNPWIDECVRSANLTPLSADAEDQRHETLHDAWILALRSRTGLVRWDDAECAAFAKELGEWHCGAEEDVAARKATTFRFESGKDGFRVVSAASRGRRALRALGQAAFVFGPLRGMRRTDAGTIAVELSRSEAESFLRSGARELADAGYSVEGCEIAAKVEAEAEMVACGVPDAGQRESAQSLKVNVLVDGEKVGAEEIRFLLDQKSSLVFFRDRWIEIDRAELREALRALERGDGKSLSVNEAIAFASGIGAVGSVEIASVRAHGWLRGLLNELKGGKELLGAEMESGHAADLCRTLRPYQRRGVAWMRFLTDHGFGALLADDMGLGKTVQTIGWMLGQAEVRPFLVVAPLTLLPNWRHELGRFAPGLRVYVHQGETRHMQTGFRRTVAETDVVVTSYSLLVRDYRMIRETEWGGIVLDEAQAIKNPDTQAARAVRALGVRRRVALTGTPIENSVADVWSVEEFLNPTFLGDRRSFAERFVKPIASDERSAAGARLRRALEPFVLRRLKDDAEIAGELGPKREVKEYCVLSARQRADYEAALEDYRAGERRQGDVFALLTRLKLICDGDGKLDRLAELLEEVFAAGESALVFTQYAKVGARIRAALAERFGRAFPFLHGGLEARAREAEIARFCGDAGPSAFVLSLRAGGFGLNLTKATHVVHFDRWWNPAVENQATDRAHRIGQKKTVFVHSFITEGTLEERVDEMLERKSRVAGSLVASGEAFLRSLAPEQFEQVVSL